MKLDRLTKPQLIEKLYKEEKLTSRLEVNLGEAHVRITELEQISAEALQTAQKASRAAETFRYTDKQMDAFAVGMEQALAGLYKAHGVLTEVGRTRAKIIQNLGKLFSPTSVCPRCGNVRHSKESNVELCDTCLAARTKSGGQV